MEIKDQITTGRVTVAELQRARSPSPPSAMPPIGGHQAGVQDASLERARWLSMNGGGA